MAKVLVDPSNENIINVGSNVRIEPGPKLVTAVATEELLHNDNSAPHYQVGTRDARGRPIELGKEITYLEWGGDVAERKDTFYIYVKMPIDNEKEFLENGDPNPHFVPQHVREAAAKGERGDDRIAYDYIWEQVATRATIEAAIEYAQSRAQD